MKRIVATVAAVTASTTLVAACGGGSSGGGAGGHEEVTLSFVSFVPKNHPLNDGFFMFMEELEKQAPWVNVEYKGGPEIMEPSQMVEGVQSGAVDGASLPGDYYVKQLPALALARFTPFTPSEERSEGVAQLWSKIHQRAGLHYLGHSTSGMPQVIFLKEKVNKPDFSGLSIRTSSATSNMVKSLGGTPVDLPGSEISTALGRGVIDGTAWTSVGADDLGIPKRVNYYVEPRFYDSIANTVISQDTWKSLDSETQDVITDTFKEMEPKIFDHYKGLAAKETAKWQKAGVKPLRFKGNEAQKILEIAYVDAWDNLDWGRISSEGSEAKQIREIFQEQYTDDLTDAIPSGAIIKPKE